MQFCSPVEWLPDITQEAKTLAAVKRTSVMQEEISYLLQRILSISFSILYSSNMGVLFSQRSTRLQSSGATSWRQPVTQKRKKSFFFYINRSGKCDFLLRMDNIPQCNKGRTHNTCFAFISIRNTNMLTVKCKLYIFTLRLF